MSVLKKVLMLAMVVFLLSGCAKVVVKSDSDPHVDLAAMHKFYVQKFTPDERDLHKLIAEQLTLLGFEATSGIEARPTYQVDALVTYKDKWMWDMTNYMLEINIEFRHPETNFLFASGSSYRTSLARKPPEAMIEEVLKDLFKK